MPAQGDLKLSLRQIQAELKLEEDMACADVATIKDLGGNKYGEMRTFTGSPIDWLVKSWLGESHASRGEGTHPGAQWLQETPPWVSPTFISPRGAMPASKCPTSVRPGASCVHHTLPGERAESHTVDRIDPRPKTLPYCC